MQDFEKRTWWDTRSFKLLLVIEGAGLRSTWIACSEKCKSISWGPTQSLSPEHDWRKVYVVVEGMKNRWTYQVQVQVQLRLLEAWTRVEQSRTWTSSWMCHCQCVSTMEECIIKKVVLVSHGKSRIMMELSRMEFKFNLKLSFQRRYRDRDGHGTRAAQFPFFFLT